MNTSTSLKFWRNIAFADTLHTAYAQQALDALLTLVDVTDVTLISRNLH